METDVTPTVSDSAMRSQVQLNRAEQTSSCHPIGGYMVPGTML